MPDPPVCMALLHEAKRTGNSGNTIIIRSHRCRRRKKKQLQTKKGQKIERLFVFNDERLPLSYRQWKGILWKNET